MTINPKGENRKVKENIKTQLENDFKDYKSENNDFYQEFRGFHIECLMKMEPAQMGHLRQLLEQINAGVDLHISRDELERLIKEFKLKTGAPCK
jgi:hypothetical protein